MILADENIDRLIIESIRSKGFEVLSVKETYRGVSDEHIIEFSKDPPRMILTADKDIGEGFRSPGEK